MDSQVVPAALSDAAAALFSGAPASDSAIAFLDAAVVLRRGRLAPVAPWKPALARPAISGRLC